MIKLKTKSEPNELFVINDLTSCQIGKECETCRTKVATFNMSYFGKFYITGPDAQNAVDWIFSNNMQKPAGTVEP
jgi:glycine cleavage system aminomethyltransferase T